jgi:hypothetical protein
MATGLHPRCPLPPTLTLPLDIFSAALQEILSAFLSIKARTSQGALRILGR